MVNFFENKPSEAGVFNSDHVVISDGTRYSVNRLIDLSRSLEPKEKSIAEFEKAMETDCWDDLLGRKLKPRKVLEAIERGKKYSEIEDHIDRIKTSNTEHPILIANIDGQLIVLDGMHRLAKSFLEKKNSVKVIQFDLLPKQAQIV